ncbi:sugar ABC transporter substrate-binding protein [Streptomyces rapamycinicus]|uniref:ABC transporter substrate-binding protein n=2 Tax=Streptomyces rapamycinicus TaxID=1226757 RepID=A0A0A0N787_STRRN|nr:extracellular solute-binding protein [Streptomyces rapamycinicus]AGP51833.1 ABC transporter substrate-binding protein [Streptomyces rapamycinicus NRRL 5491]MBB4779251.1 multiple sugar transport system substrate-binding protein [Streptomyces rapamycinicus]RLV76086.1 ABC transporter substrate-binding protein [Streptomyces rapamycinicus NRRL 5491]UTP28048.1 extracellular solute-binding protein [Streptomyces rapamycinicus NRRL 5491]
MNKPTRRRLTATAMTVVALTVGTAACSSGDGTTSAKAADSGTYTLWDPYPQFAKNSAWAKLLDGCGSRAGVKIKRTAFDTSDLTNKALLAAQQDNSPDILVLDNPVVSTLAEAGTLTTTDENKVDTSKVDRNLLAAGQPGGKTYGTPIGANTLALYYNKDVLKAAGVDIASVKDWKSLTAALEKVKKAGKKGITFSAIGTEEGSFQFLPWFWGSGAKLTDLDSSGAASALSLWSDWLKKGYAPNSVINNTQTTSWQEFASGDYAFAENGTWQLAGAEKAGFDYGVLPIPGADGGSAPAPTGGEFVTVPVQGDTGRYTTTRKLVTCLTSTENLYDTDTTLSYVAPTSAVQDKQVASDAKLKPWVEAVKSAKGRTSDDLGTKYPKISEQMWKAVQSALSGADSPKDALTAAQDAVK